MSIFFKARGTPSIGILLIRLALGGYFLVLGIAQAGNLEAYVNRIKSYGVLGENIAFITGFVLPFVLIIFGALYIMGFFTPATSIVLSLVLLGKLIVKGLFQPDAIPFNRDLILLTCTLLTLFGGAGVISFDALLDRKKKREIDVKKNVVTAEVVQETPKSSTADTEV
jgi:uncharacterized membrane protein YphA (DoxX/SURF4 family)